MARPISGEGLRAVSREAWERVGKPRAISRDIWEARGYEPWTVDDPSRVQAAYETLPQGWQKGRTTTWAKRTNGVLIHRFAPPGLGLPHVYAELRPDNKIVSGRKWTEPHRHDYERDVPGWERDSYRHFTISEARNHIVRTHAGLTPSDITNDEIRQLPLDQLREWNQRGTHRHLADPTQYLFPPGFDENGIGLASRLDMHPDSVALLGNADYAFFGIEGCLKADAILTAIVADGLQAAVFSVPAVWLWFRAEELQSFIWKRLLGKRVVIVCDADWFTKWEVREAAHRCKQRLEELGLRCCVAAPAYEPNDLDGETGKPRLNGVDDYLADGGKLLDLRVLEREHAPNPIVAVVAQDIPWISEAAGLVPGKRANTRALDRLVAVHEATAGFHHEGVIRKSPRTAEAQTGFNKDYISRGWADAVDAGLYNVTEGSMELVYDAFSGERRYRVQPSLEPLDLILPKDKPARSVRDWLGEWGVANPGKSETEGEKLSGVGR